MTLPIVMNDFESISEEVLRLLQECSAALENPEALVAVARSILPGNGADRAGKHAKPHEMAHWFYVATQRCDEGNFERAIPIALNLLVTDPFDFRYSFILELLPTHGPPARGDPLLFFVRTGQEDPRIFFPARGVLCSHRRYAERRQGVRYGDPHDAGPWRVCGVARTLAPGSL